LDVGEVEEKRREGEGGRRIKKERKRGQVDDPLLC
jgi:hypothetical protein